MPTKTPAGARPAERFSPSHRPGARSPAGAALDVGAFGGAATGLNGPDAPRESLESEGAETTWTDRQAADAHEAGRPAGVARAGEALGDAGFSSAMVVVLPDLRAYAAALAGSGVEGDDLVQDALVRIWRYRASFQPEASLRAWMFSVLRNEFRSQRGRRQPWIEDVDGKLSAARSCAPEQEWRIAWREVVAALATLPPPNRQALLLVVALGCTYAEAAAICACEVRTLKGRIHRARARLARLTGWEELLKSRSARLGAAPRDLA
jgi:RNA polymerase sigma-70 factor (ECF subfamily)